MTSESSTVAMESLMVSKQESVNPADFPNEVFDLLSIPAFDQGCPQVAEGRDIGSSKKVVHPGDVLLSRIVPHIRRAWVVPESTGRRQIASGEWIVLRGDTFDPRYVRHMVISDFFHIQFMNTVAGVGGSLLRARPTFVAKIQIPLPPLAEQKRIADILDKADAIRRKRQQAIEQLDTLVQSTFLDMFGDPVTNPMGWEQRPVSDVCRLVRGSSPRPKGDSRYYGGPIPRLMVGDITRDGFWVTPRIDSLTELGAESSRPVPKGTVVMAVSGNVGVVGIVQIPCCIHDGFVAFLDMREALFTPIFFMIQFHLMKITHEQRKAGAIFQNLTTNDIKSMRIAVPPLKKQRQFQSVVESIERQKSLLLESAVEVKNLFASTQSRAFAGEL